ncbi:ArnT family glycosyltransferase [Spongiimicrobium salis]|uniref:ArnT family glycosyltransferase n=1 Tax=Spongiimicrobium salis TaxID=1667022 RepID=UPI00374CFD65
MLQKIPKPLRYLLAALFLLNIVQAYFTELIFDEAYYWHYAQNLAWGYFDHPPMVALLIKISSFFFEGELGVRFMSCLLAVGTIVVLWTMIDDAKKQRYSIPFFVLIFSMPLVNAYGFFTLPDTPLLFFTALFLWCYKKFLSSPSIIVCIALGVVMAALMYSKYHAALVILFVLLSNIKLIGNKYAWLSVIVALLCYTPHFLWLYQNDFVSIKYHLFERPNRAYEFADFTLGYFLSLVVLFGLTFPFAYRALYKTKAIDLFTKALLYLTYGVLIFFFVSSFNRRVQAQWVIVASIPMILIIFRVMLQHKHSMKWIYRLGMVNIVLLCYARIWLVYSPALPIHFEAHDNTTWVSGLQAQIGDMPVVFENSYRNTPMYAFYSGVPAYSLNNIRYRRNQYSLDSTEYAIQHQRVLYVSKYAKRKDITYTTQDGSISYGMYIDNFESFRKLQCILPEEDISLKDTKEQTLKVYNPYFEDIDLNKITFELAYMNAYKQVKDVVPLQTTLANPGTRVLKARDTTSFRFTLPAPKIENPGYFKIGISENGLRAGLNGKTTKLE